MMSKKMWFDFWSREDLTKPMRLDPSQMKRLLGDSEVRAKLRDARMVSLLPPVGTEIFRRFTPASLDERQKRKNEEVEEKDPPKPATHLEADKPLPFVYGDPPPEILNTPLEELDPFYQSQKTFIVISRGNVLHRFNAESSCFLLSPFSLTRTIAIRTLTHPLFRFFILMTILSNCVVMTMTCPPAWTNSAESLFSAIFVFEVVVKIVSRGVCIGTFTFLRDPWNWLDVAVVITTFVTELVDLRKASVLRTIPRVLKLMSVYPGVKMTAGALVQSVKRLAHVIVMSLVVLSIGAMIGLQLYMGSLRQKCVMWPQLDNQSYHKYINSPVNHYFFSGQLDAMLCGNGSSAGVCPEGFTCLRTDTNPNYGFTNYDSFGFSLLSVVRLMSKDFWENLFQLMMRTEGKTSVIVFLLFLFSGSFFLVSLLLVVVAMTSVEQVEVSVAEDRRREEEFIQIQEVMKRREEEPAVCSVEDSEKHDPPQKKKLAELQENQSSCPPCCLSVVKWNCCGCWTRLKLRLCTFVTNPFFDLIIVVCILLNCLFFAMEHHPMTLEFDHLLHVTYLIFTGIFTAEMLLRLVAMGPYHYFRVGWNVFDSIIVALSLVELVLVDFGGLTVLMRGLRLGRWWPTLHMLMKIIWTSVGALRNLTLVLLIMVFFFTVVGMRLFQDDYRDHVCRIAVDCELPRWHMQNFFNTFVLIFRLLCGEWIETLWDCMEVSGQSTCLIFFIGALVIGNLLLLNLFLALFLSSIRGDYLVAPIEKEGNNLKIAIDQIKAGVAWILEHIWTLLGKKNPVNSHPKVVDGKDNNKEYLGLTFVTSDHPLSESRARGSNPGNETSECHNSAPCRVPVAEAEVDLKMSESEEEKHKDEDDETHRGNTPEDCCCYSSFLDVDASQTKGRFWSNFRKACFSIVQHKLFEAFFIFIIVLSSAALVFEDVHLRQHPVVSMVLDKADQVFTFLFLLEMLLKWIACGFKKYFTSAGCWLDFLILVVSLMSLALGMLGYSGLGAGRALRPLRALSRFQGMRVVLKVLAASFPFMCNVLLVSVFVWFLFSAAGVNLFAGKFSFCLNETSETFFSQEDVNNKSECLLLSLNLMQENVTDIRWKSMKVHYDNVAAGYLALLQVATFKGWMDIMYAAVDSREAESQPVYDSNIYMYLYFVCFIIIGCFFTFNLIIRVFINTLRHKIRKRVFMTDEQQNFSRSMKNLLDRPAGRVPRPQNRCQARLFDLVTSRPFEVVIVVLICLNAVTIMVETDQQSEEMEKVLHWIHFTFVILYITELILKIVALRQHYFSSCLNILDFTTILIFIVGFFLADIIEKYFVSPSLFTCVRLARVSRFVLLLRATQGLRRLLVAFMMSLPALFNILLLHFLFMFTFSIFGMLSFAHVKREAQLDDMMNFETFVNSMICMLMVTTTAGWDGLLIPFLNTPPDCDPDVENPGSTVRGNCGNPTVSIIFFTSYIILSLVLVVLLYVAVILETLTEDDPEQPSDDDLQIFYKTWRKFDADASQVIQYSQLSDFCDSLQDPLRIPKPNRIKLIHMDLPLLPGDTVHCVDVLLALTAQVFGDSGQMDTLKAKMEKKFLTNNLSKMSYQPISSTLQRKQEEVAATVIQKAYRKYLLQDTDPEQSMAELAGVAAGV